MLRLTGTPGPSLRSRTSAGGLPDPAAVAAGRAEGGQRLRDHRCWRRRPDRRRDSAGPGQGAAHRRATADRLRAGRHPQLLRDHVHIDHYSLAVELRKSFRSLVSLGEEERANLIATRELISGSHTGHKIFGSESLRRLGAPNLADQLAELDRHGPAIVDWEDPDRWVADGTDLDLRTRTLRAVHTPGHTRGHLIFHDAAARIMFAGDHVLPLITPSIGSSPRLTGWRCATTSAR